jgi:hypothetical protein
MRYKAVQLLDELPLSLGRWLHAFSTAELCQLLIGYAHARHYHEGVLNALAPLLAARVRDLSLSELAIVMWAFGVFQHHPPTSQHLLPSVLAQLGPRLGRGGGRPQTFAMVAKACANLRLQAPELMQQVAEGAEQRLNDFRPEELAMLLYGMSHLLVMTEVQTLAPQSPERGPLNGSSSSSSWSVGSSGSGSSSGINSNSSGSSHGSLSRRPASGLQTWHALIWLRRRGGWPWAASGPVGPCCPAH